MDESKGFVGARADCGASRIGHIIMRNHKLCVAMLLKLGKRQGKEGKGSRAICVQENDEKLGNVK
jgi:hypothetical protein